MGKQNKQNTIRKISRSAKECAFLATFVALIIAVQLAFSAVAGIELVTALFVVYALVMGVTRGVLVATAFSLLRQLLFGFFPNVLLLYLIYYNVVAVYFGFLGKWIQACKPAFKTVLVTVSACISTVLFTLLDDVITPVFFGYTWEATQAYFWASLSVMLPHVICVAVSTACLCVPLDKTFTYLYKKL